MEQSERDTARDLGRLESDSLRKQAARAIRARIVRGDIAPGRIYTVAHFASRLGVSATPVREALLDLSSEGLVEVVRTRGYRVVELDEKDLDNLFQLRQMLEAPAVAHLAGRLDPETLAECRGYVEEMEELAASLDFIGFTETDLRFHLRLLEEFGNTRLVEIARKLRLQVRAYRVPDFLQLTQAEELQAMAREHRLILEAIERGDATEVERLLRQHFENARGCAWLRRTKTTKEQAG